MPFTEEDAGLGADLRDTEPLPAKLTMDGYFLLGDHYPPGTLVDPVRLGPVA